MVWSSTRQNTWSCDLRLFRYTLRSAQVRLSWNRDTIQPFFFLANRFNARISFFDPGKQSFFINWNFKIRENSSQNKGSERKNCTENHECGIQKYNIHSCFNFNKWVQQNFPIIKSREIIRILAQSKPCTSLIIVLFISFYASNQVFVVQHLDKSLHDVSNTIFFIALSIAFGWFANEHEYECKCELWPILVFKLT